MRVLIVEDDRRLSRALRRLLEEEDYTVDEAHDGVEGEALAREGGYQIIMLDFMLPGRDGVMVCENLRSHGITTPILMLTARDTAQDRRRALVAGVDAYLIKPFASAELLVQLYSLSHSARQQAEG